ncbi:MAG: electron transfer flavoprotein subunit beta/FixA family protein [Bacillota bacterium]
MNIIVCIKQVPSTTNVEVDPVTGVLKRDGIKSKMNPYDLFALEQAFLLRERYGGTVAALSMGPNQARDVLYEALYMGADSAVLASDRRFAGADVLATGYTLSQCVRKMGEYDLIICGKQTTDGDTAQVGPEMAELLGIPHACNVLSVDGFSEGTLTVKANMDHSVYTVKMKAPCLITMEKDVNTPRLPSYLRRKKRGDAEISVWGMEDLPDQDESHYGLTGSPTQVERIFPPEVTEDRECFSGSGEELAARLYSLLREKKRI